MIGMRAESKILEQAKKIVIEEIESDILANGYKSCGQDLLRHIHEVEKWARVAIVELKKKHYVNEEEVMLAVWIHDIVMLSNNPEDLDDAEMGAIKVREILDRTNVAFLRVENIINYSCICRKKKKKPDTIEAKILVFANAIAKMSSGIYLRMLSDGKSLTEAKAKLEEDYRNSFVLQELQWVGSFLHGSWKTFLNSFPMPEGFRVEEDEVDSNEFRGTFTRCAP